MHLETNENTNEIKINELDNIISLVNGNEDKQQYCLEKIVDIFNKCFSYENFGILNNIKDGDFKEKVNEVVLRTINQKFLENILQKIKESDISYSDIEPFWGFDKQINEYYRFELFEWIIRNDKIELLNEILDKKLFDPNIKCLDLTPLLYACRADNVGAVSSLIKHGANANICFPLHYMIKSQLKNKVSIIKFLSNKNRSDLNKKDNDGKTPLDYAIENSNLEIVELLLKRKADPNMRDDDGWTPLYYAINNNKQEIFDYLLEKTKIDLFCKSDLQLFECIISKKDDNSMGNLKKLLLHVNDINVEMVNSLSNFISERFKDNKTAIEFLEFLEGEFKLLISCFESSKKTPPQSTINEAKLTESQNNFVVHIPEQSDPSKLAPRRRVSTLDEVDTQNNFVVHMPEQSDPSKLAPRKRVSTLAKVDTKTKTSDSYENDKMPKSKEEISRRVLKPDEAKIVKPKVPSRQ